MENKPPKNLSAGLLADFEKAGNYFYIIIDRADDGENTVRFLNRVDEADLLALMEEEQTEATPIVCSCTDKCQAGAVNTCVSGKNFGSPHRTFFSRIREV